MLARWDSAIGLDAPGARDLPQRQQTLRRAIDWSYELLGAEERALLRRLAVFPGGFDIAAVEAACGGDGEILPALDRGARSSRSPGSSIAAWSSATPTIRRAAAYRQLRTVREYLARATRRSAGTRPRTC